ncbi:hypothetical protein ACFL25_00375, partial [Patescibacteria group bacterium]
FPVGCSFEVEAWNFPQFDPNDPNGYVTFYFYTWAPGEEKGGLIYQQDVFVGEDGQGGNDLDAQFEVDLRPYLSGEPPHHNGWHIRVEAYIHSTGGWKYKMLWYNCPIPFEFTTDNGGSCLEVWHNVAYFDGPLNEVWFEGEMKADDAVVASGQGWFSKGNTAFVGWTPDLAQLPGESAIDHDMTGEIRVYDEPGGELLYTGYMPNEDQPPTLHLTCKVNAELSCEEKHVWGQVDGDPLLIVEAHDGQHHELYVEGDFNEYFDWEVPPIGYGPHHVWFHAELYNGNHLLSVAHAEEEELICGPAIYDVQSYVGCDKGEVVLETNIPGTFEWSIEKDGVVLDSGSEHVAADTTKAVPWDLNEYGPFDLGAWGKFTPDHTVLPPAEEEVNEEDLTCGQATYSVSPYVGCDKGEVVLETNIPGTFEWSIEKDGVVLDSGSEHVAADTTKAVPWDLNEYGPFDLGAWGKFTPDHTVLPPAEEEVNEEDLVCGEQPPDFACYVVDVNATLVGVDHYLFEGYAYGIGPEGQNRRYDRSRGEPFGNPVFGPEGTSKVWYDVDGDGIQELVDKHSFSHIGPANKWHAVEFGEGKDMVTSPTCLYIAKRDVPWRQVQFYFTPQIEREINAMGIESEDWWAGKDPAPHAEGPSESIQHDCWDGNCIRATHVVTPGVSFPISNTILPRIDTRHEKGMIVEQRWIKLGDGGYMLESTNVLAEEVDLDGMGPYAWLQYTSSAMYIKMLVVPFKTQSPAVPDLDGTHSIAGNGYGNQQLHGRTIIVSPELWNQRDQISTDIGIGAADALNQLMTRMHMLTGDGAAYWGPSEGENDRSMEAWLSRRGLMSALYDPETGTIPSVLQLPVGTVVYFHHGRERYFPHGFYVDEGGFVRQGVSNEQLATLRAEYSAPWIDNDQRPNGRGVDNGVLGGWREEAKNWMRAHTVEMNGNRWWEIRAPWDSDGDGKGDLVVRGILPEDFQRVQAEGGQKNWTAPWASVSEEHRDITVDPDPLSGE